MLVLALERLGLAGGLWGMVAGARRDPLEVQSIREARQIAAALAGIFRQRDGGFWEDRLSVGARASPFSGLPGGR